MQKMFDDLWENYMINVNIIQKVDQNPKECQMFTFFPYSKFYCEKVFPVLMNTFVADKGFIKGEDHFPNKMSNMHQCPITVATFEIQPFVVLETTKSDGSLQIGGFDGMLIQNLAEKMNFKLHYKILNDTLWGTIAEDGTSSGAISMVMHKEVNFTAGYFTSSPLRNLFMASSYVYYTSNLIWVIPPGQ
jgi:Ligated ion channel L-glutamate- and glycine-binding site